MIAVLMNPRFDLVFQAASRICFAFTNLLKRKQPVGVRRRLVYAAGFRLAGYIQKEVARKPKIQ